MSYLDRLKRIDNGEIFHHTPKHEPTKPSKGVFVGFVGPIPGVDENIYSGHGNAEKPLSREQGSIIRAWLAHIIEETDHDIIAEVLDKCCSNPKALAYFLWRAEEMPRLLPSDDDRRSCSQCSNLSGRRLCMAEKRGEFFAGRKYQPVSELRRRRDSYLPGDPGLWAVNHGE